MQISEEDDAISAAGVPLQPCWPDEKRKLTASCYQGFKSSFHFFAIIPNTHWLLCQAVHSDAFKRFCLLLSSIFHPFKCILPIFAVCERLLLSVGQMNGPSDQVVQQLVFTASLRSKKSYHNASMDKIHPFGQWVHSQWSSKAAVIQSSLLHGTKQN